MQFHKKILPNGLRLITITMKDNPTVTVMVLVEAGSKYETRNISGISHFLEHLCFKGTKKRPKPFDIVKELDGHGCQYNAFTAQEMTGYYAKSDRKHFRKVLDVVSDIYLNSAIPADEMEKERGVIVEEIKMYQDLPPRHIHDILMAGLYGDQPAGWDVAGTPETVRAVSRDDIVRYRGAHYLPDATLVVVSGNVDEREAEDAVAAAFADMPRGAKEKKRATQEIQRAPALFIEEKKTDQVHLAFGIRTCNLYHDDIPAMRVLAAALGGGMSSRLFQKMRDELGICYYIGAAHETFTDHGFLEITAGVPESRLLEALSAILGEVRAFAERLVSEEECARIAEYLIGNLYLGLESSDSVAEFYGFQEIVRKSILRSEEVAKRIRHVTARDISRVAREYFVSPRLNLALIGSVRNRGEVEKLLRL